MVKTKRCSLLILWLFKIISVVMHQKRHFFPLSKIAKLQITIMSFEMSFEINNIQQKKTADFFSGIHLIFIGLQKKIITL
jgi:hypothetical protein